MQRRTLRTLRLLFVTGVTESHCKLTTVFLATSGLKINAHKSSHLQTANIQFISSEKTRTSNQILKILFSNKVNSYGMVRNIIL